MRIVGDKTRRFAANSMFPSFLCGQTGLVLAQMAAVQLHGGWGLRVFLGLPGLVLLALELFRARLHWAAAGAGPRSADARALAWYLVLIASGAAIGPMIRAGSLLLLGLATTVAYAVPWTTIPLCRARFVAAWTLRLPSITMHLVVLVALDRGYGIGEDRALARHANPS